MVDYSILPRKEVLSRLDASDGGLSTRDAQERRGIYGENRIKDAERIHPFIIFLSQFASPIVWILLVALGISFFMGEYVDFYVIGAVLVLNAILGFVQEYRAERAIEALRKLISLKATVLRDGQQKQIDASELVPGDILLLSTGDKVPADAYVLEAVNLQVQESILTGESIPVRKSAGILQKAVSVADRSNMVFSSTVVTNGHAKAVVTGIGMGTEIGKIASLIQATKPEPTPLQKMLSSISVMIGIVVVAIAMIVFIVELIKFDQPLSELLLTAIALAVAAVPEGLPAVVTVGLSIGVQRMARKNALVRHLPSVETLGSCTVICSDKTGTLTQNELTVRKVYVNRSVIEVAGTGYSPEGYFSKDPKSFELLLKIGALDNNAVLKKEDGQWQVIGDPTEGALIVSAKKALLDIEKLHLEWQRVDEVEFTSERKMMTTIHKNGKSLVAFCKGAPEVVLDNCSKIIVNGRVERLSREEKEKIVAQNESFAKASLRVLACAYRELSAGDKKYEHDLIFVGLQAMIDPPRRDAKDAVQKCKDAGIKIVMITGDHLTTAQTIARELGIEGRCVTGEELDAMTDLAKQVEQIGVYARVNPEHKLKIVRALQQNGHIVAMTGDGVNDAPALKKADIGIAMGLAGTDVAKEASSMILADDNFATIVRAIEEGRRIYDNIQKYVAYLLSGNIGEVLIVLGSILIGLPLPLVAVQILWINLVTDGLPALALGVDPPAPSIMRRPPRKAQEWVFKGIEQYLFVCPVIFTIAGLWLFDAYVVQGIDKARTMIFTLIVVFELFIALSCRSTSEPALRVGLFKNRYLWAAVFSSLALQAAIMYVPFLAKIFDMVALSASEWGLVLLIGSLGFVYPEVHKAIAGRR